MFLPVLTSLRLPCNAVDVLTSLAFNPTPGNGHHAFIYLQRRSRTASLDFSSEPNPHGSGMSQALRYLSDGSHLMNALNRTPLCE
jgi:hypothetical protein